MKSKTYTISQSTGVKISITFALMLAGALVSGVTWINMTQNNINELNSAVTSNTIKIDKLQSDNNEAKLKYTEIATQLRNIDATLVEIKQRLR